MNERLPTLSDVARRAGVSYATADRVVNGRGGVAEKSGRRVREAIAALGYVRNVAAANLSQRRTYRFAVVIPGGSNAFFARIREILSGERERLRPERIDLAVETVAAFDPAALVGKLSRIGRSGPDGVALVGIDHDWVVRAIAALHDAGAAVLTLVSDVPGAGRDAYVGIDNRAAGRTAGRMIGLAHGGRPGRVLPLVGALTARDHAERLEGLYETLAANFPAIEIAPEIEGRDRHEVVEARLAPALEADPQITAIYSAGAGNAGLIRVLGAIPTSRSRPIVVLHEVVPHTRRALSEGLIDVVIDQRPDVEIATALACLRRIVDRRPAEPVDPIVPAVLVAENLPPAAPSPSA